MLKPALTILINQWGKPVWLAGCLRSIARQLTANSPVQILIGDDGIRTGRHGPPLGGYSEAFTEQLIADSLGDRMDKCRYLRWPESEPKTTMHNLNRTLPHAEGEWVWVMGNNDAVFDGAISHLLQVIQYRLTSHTQYIYFNYHGYHVNPEYPHVPVKPELVVATEKHDLRPTDLTLSRLALIGGEEPHAFTPLYCGAMRRDTWSTIMQTFREGVAAGEPRWSPRCTSVAVANYIIDNLLQQPAYYIHRPMLLMNYSSTWKQEANNEKWRGLLDATRKRLAARCKSILS